MTLPLPAGQRPRKWQVEALDAARQAFRVHRKVLVSAATGTGKGSYAAGIGALTADRGRRVLVLAHREELVADVADRIRLVRPGARVGFIGAGEAYGLALPVVVAMVQSLTKARLAELLSYGAFDLIITDEAHHATAPTYQAVYAANEAAKPDWKHLGLTATPFRAGAKGEAKKLGAVFEVMAYEYSIADAIAQGDLVPIRGQYVSTSLSLSGVKVGKTGDFQEADLAAVVDCESRNVLVVEQYLERVPGKPALVFAASIEHAKHLAEAFRARGVNAAAVWGEMGDARTGIIAQFKNRPDQLPVLCSKDLIFEGFDAPQCAAILKARPTQSRIVFTQMVGRGLRTWGIDQSLVDPLARRAAIAASPKPECLLLDFVDNGCELDLATVADLDEETTRPVAERASLVVGDRVVRRLHEDWGKGTVTAVAGDGPEATVSVFWPLSKAHPATARLSHQALELRKVREDAPVAEEIRIEPKVTGVKVFPMVVLPGNVASAKAIGWYAYQTALVAAGELPSGERLTFYIEGAGAEWFVWSIVGPPARDRGRVPDVVRLEHTAPTSEAALEWSERRFKEERARVHRVSADWKGEAATEKQVAALKKWGIRRDLTDFSRGEASALLDAVMAKAKVRAHQKQAGVAA